MNGDDGKVEKAKSGDALAESTSQKLSLLLTQESVDKNSVPTIWIDLQKDRYIYVNESACRLFGYSREEFLSAPPGLLHPEGALEYWDMLHKHCQERSLQKKLKLRKKTGFIIPALLDATYLTHEGTEYCFATLLDMSEHQAMMEKLQQAQKMEAVGTLAGGIAHDFNNILSAIYGYIQLAQLAEDDREKRENALDGIFQATNRAKNLVKQILTFSRQGKQEKRSLPMGILGKEVMKLIRQTVPTTIEIRQNITSKRNINADPTQIHQVIMNLCTNAYQAMKTTGGILTVNLEDVHVAEPIIKRAVTVEPGEYIRLTVGDTGTGIDEAIFDRIFQPYFTTKGQGEGTGLGLSVVHGIVTDHRGYILVESGSAKGAVFTVYFPAIEEDAAAADHISSQAGGILHGQERILFVDDEQTVLDVHMKVFRKYGYSIETFIHPREALDRFLRAPQEFDLLITDMTMPKLTGIELIREVKKVRADLPVFLCTGYSDLIDSEKALAEGVSEFIYKPYPMKRLIATVRENLDRKKI